MIRWVVPNWLRHRFRKPAPLTGLTGSSPVPTASKFLTCSMIYRFYKNETGWFIDLPNYPLSKAHLAMVKGADILLNQLSENGNEIYAEISTQPIPDYTDVLDRVKKLGLSKGAIYKGNKIKINYKILEENNLWLCPVTLFVFWYYPKRIYYRILPSPPK